MRIVVLMSCLVFGGCVNGGGSWGHAPEKYDFLGAAKTAAVDPRTWIPVAGAGLLVATDVDQRWTKSLARDQPVFGDDAADVSDDVRDLATLAYFATALAAPSESVNDKLRGIGVGVATMLVDGAVSQGLKDVVGRDRPDGSNNQSLPSGHASKTASRARLAMDNLAAMDLKPWQNKIATWSLQSLAPAAAIARVEANKHHISDVLLGLALGNFVAVFMQEAFLGEGSDQAVVGVVPVSEGLALRITVAL